MCTITGHFKPRGVLKVNRQKVRDTFAMQLTSIAVCRFLNAFFDQLEFGPIEAFCKVWISPPALQAASHVITALNHLSALQASQS